MAGALVRGFGLTFLPLRQPTVKWKIALFARRRDLALARGGEFSQLHAGFCAELDGGGFGEPAHVRTAQEGLAKPYCPHSITISPTMP